MYKCSECETPIIVIEGQVVRACPHQEAVVIADISATATGESDLNNGAK
jgi:hypothetical protein